MNIDPKAKIAGIPSPKIRKRTMNQAQESAIIGFLMYLCGVAVGFGWARLRDRFASPPTKKDDAPPTLSFVSAPKVNKTAPPPTSPPGGAAAPPKVLPGEVKAKTQSPSKDVREIQLWQKWFLDNMTNALVGRVQRRIVNFISRQTQELELLALASQDHIMLKTYMTPFTGSDHTEVRWLPSFDGWVGNVLSGNISDDEILVINGIGEKSLAELKTGMSAWAKENAKRETKKRDFYFALRAALEDRVPMRVLLLVTRNWNENMPSFDDWANDILEGRISEDDLLQMRMMGKKSVEQLTAGLREWKKDQVN